MATFAADSRTIVQTDLPVGERPRNHYLARPLEHATPPAIAYSAGGLVPHALVEHLMRRKRDSAINRKFVPGSAITNMEGAMHTFVTPLVPVFMHGDYRFTVFHTVQPLPSYSKPDDGNGGPLVGGREYQSARVVVLSALVQPDFETDEVMAALARLDATPVEGTALPVDFAPLSVDRKQDAAERARYDAALRRHMVAHLTRARRLPARTEPVAARPLSVDDAELLVARAIVEGGPAALADAVVDTFVRLPRPHSNEVLSLELLFNAALEQTTNEFRALERLTGEGGYVYTWDPPSIFARLVGARLLNRLTLAALQTVAAQTRLYKLRAYAFNDYTDKDALGLARVALQTHPSVPVVSKSALFNGGVYAPHEVLGQEKSAAVLVIHNNSDAFGQNIETEDPPHGSLDGAIGAYSSAAASLHRRHPKLLDVLV